jgi:nucleoside diphosphate kinase
MAEELAFVTINPYTIRKSRTGGVIGRLLSRSRLELVGARMYAPSQQMVDEYLDTIRIDQSHPNWHVKKLIKQYILANYAPDKGGHRHRVMFLLFRGQNAIRELKENVVGHITRGTIAGETIRDTYGDYILGPDGKVTYFEPAVMLIPSAKEAEAALAVWAKYAARDGGLLSDVIPYPSGVEPQATTVILKPELFTTKSIRAGNVIDIFSRAGLYIIGIKLLEISVEQAEKFYGPVRSSLKEKLGDKVVGKAKLAIERELGFSVPQETIAKIHGDLSDLAAEDQFNQIVKYMTGRDCKELSKSEKAEPGKVKCLALVYQGEDAIRKIREIVGATDPRKAEVATVRREFGHDIMVNAAHASDSPENAKREIGIIDFQDDNISPLIEDYLAKMK